MQNEACIKQGSEKESIRQQLTDATALAEQYAKCTDCDAVERTAILAIVEAGAHHAMSPKAFIQAVAAIEDFIDKRKDLLEQGFAAYAKGDFSIFETLNDKVKTYSTARAQMLGYQKSLTPTGWDILEE